MQSASVPLLTTPPASASAMMGGSSLWIGSLNRNITPLQLKRGLLRALEGLFHGIDVYVPIPEPPTSQYYSPHAQNRGYAFIEFPSQEEADRFKHIQHMVRVPAECLQRGVKTFTVGNSNRNNSTVFVTKQQQQQQQQHSALSAWGASPPVTTAAAASSSTFFLPPPVATTSSAMRTQSLSLSCSIPLMPLTPLQYSSHANVAALAEPSIKQQRQMQLQMQLQQENAMTSSIHQHIQSLMEHSSSTMMFGAQAHAASVGPKSLEFSSTNSSLQSDIEFDDSALLCPLDTADTTSVMDFDDDNNNNDGIDDDEGAGGSHDPADNDDPDGGSHVAMRMNAAALKERQGCGGGLDAFWETETAAGTLGDFGFQIPLSRQRSSSSTASTGTGCTSSTLQTRTRQQSLVSMLLCSPGDHHHPHAQQSCPAVAAQGLAGGMAGATDLFLQTAPPGILRLLIGKLAQAMDLLSGMESAPAVGEESSARTQRVGDALQLMRESTGVLEGYARSNIDWGV